MKSTILGLVLIGILSFGLCNSGFAQGQGQKPSAARDKAPAAKPMTITGCLQKGDEPGEYEIKDTDGKEYGLRSKSVNLADHLDHKVTVTGRAMRGENQKARKAKEEHEHMNVTSLKMVSNSCK
jgi:hypothetical protein